MSVFPTQGSKLFVEKKLQQQLPRKRPLMVFQQWQLKFEFGHKKSIVFLGKKGTLRKRWVGAYQTIIIIKKQ